MVKLFVPLEVDMKAVLDSDLHFHRSDFCLFDFIIGEKHCKVDLFSQGRLHVSGQNDSDEISDSAGYPIESFILFFKVGEFEFAGFILSQDSSRLKLL